jgi:hypothetical protein
MEVGIPADEFRAILAGRELTLGHAARLLNVDYRTVRRWAGTGVDARRGAMVLLLRAMAEVDGVKESLERQAAVRLGTKDPETAEEAVAQALEPRPG